MSRGQGTVRLVVAPNKDPEKSPKRWIRIGRGTRLEGNKLICTMDSIPLNWDGVFMILEEDGKEPNG